MAWRHKSFGDSAPDASATRIHSLRESNGAKRMDHRQGVRQPENSTNTWSLDRPVQYVSLEFIPEGRRELVVAADNIDAGSIPNLKVGQSVAVQYERANPRNA